MKLIEPIFEFFRDINWSDDVYCHQCGKKLEYSNTTTKADPKTGEILEVTEYKWCHGHVWYHRKVK